MKNLRELFRGRYRGGWLVGWVSASLSFFELGCCSDIAWVRVLYRTDEVDWNWFVNGVSVVTEMECML